MRAGEGIAMERRPTTPRSRGNLTGHDQPSDSVPTGKDCTGSGPPRSAVFPRQGEDRRPAVRPGRERGGDTVTRPTGGRPDPGKETGSAGLSASCAPDHPRRGRGWFRRERGERPPGSPLLSTITTKKMRPRRYDVSGSENTASAVIRGGSGNNRSVVRWVRPSQEIRG